MIEVFFPTEWTGEQALDWTRERDLKLLLFEAWTNQFRFVVCFEPKGTHEVV